MYWKIVIHENKKKKKYQGRQSAAMQTHNISDNENGKVQMWLLFFFP